MSDDKKKAVPPRPSPPRPPPRPAAPLPPTAPRTSDRNTAVAAVSAVVEEEIELIDDPSIAPPAMAPVVSAPPLTAVSSPRIGSAPAISAPPGAPSAPRIGSAPVISVSPPGAVAISSRPGSAPAISVTPPGAVAISSRPGSAPAISVSPPVPPPAISAAPAPSPVVSAPPPVVSAPPPVVSAPPPVTAPSRAPADDPDSRSSRRFPFEINLDIVSEHNFYAGLSLNISEGGLFVATHVEYPVGTRLEIRLLLPGDDEPTSIMTEVRWVRPHNENADGSAGMGLRFVGLTPDVMAKVHRFAEERDPLYYEDD